MFVFGLHFCFCLYQNGCESQICYHPCFSANTINNKTPFPPQIVSIFPEPHVPVENMPYLSLQLPVLTNYTHKRMGHNRPISLNLSASLFLSQECLIHLIKEQIIAFLAWPILDKHYCLVKPTAIILLHFIKQLNC